MGPRVYGEMAECPLPMSTRPSLGVSHDKAVRIMRAMPLENLCPLRTGTSTHISLRLPRRSDARWANPHVPCGGSDSQRGTHCLAELPPLQLSSHGRRTSPIGLRFFAAASGWEARH